MESEAQDDDYDLSVIVPVYNAEAHLKTLVQRVFALDRLGLRCQMICIDDASTDQSVPILRELANQYPGLIVIENHVNRGAGMARNDGWPHATGRYSIFFDADDTLHPEVVVTAVRDMDNDPELDLAIFAYRYERDKSAKFTEMGYEDRKIFDLLLQGNSAVKGEIENMARLLIFTNYPWNKVLRTAHYREMGMRFGCTKVNNDILGHWYSLLLSRKIMVCNAVLCTHIVHPKGANLTNAFGAERLSMFEALNETYDFLEARPACRRRYAHQFWALANRLVAWALPRLDPSLRNEFEVHYTELLSRLDLGDLARMRSKRSPALANSLVNYLIH